MKELEAENAKLTHMYAELSLDHVARRDVGLAKILRPAQKEGGGACVDP